MGNKVWILEQQYNYNNPNWFPDGQKVINVREYQIFPNQVEAVNYTIQNLMDSSNKRYTIQSLDESAIQQYRELRVPYQKYLQSKINH